MATSEIPKGVILEGPEIDVTFEVSKQFIQHIGLKTRKGKGLAWTVIGASDVFTQKIESWLKDYCRGIHTTSLPLQMAHLPPFTKDVLEALPDIPFGSTCSYQEIAIRLGNPKAPRAVGQACGRNPFPLVLPCHRVLATNGIGGFNCGLPIKETLLAFESR
ncbi:MAG: methylated-DNA--[protein]-cysteine S-methyltransferase [Parachlamydia sp.]|nr:methylated-DNA--[protein]-cysteine S-methyltransferase [Parachlamydia sp.]